MASTAAVTAAAAARRAGDSLRARRFKHAAAASARALAACRSSVAGTLSPPGGTVGWGLWAGLSPSVRAWGADSASGRLGSRQSHKKG